VPTKLRVLRVTADQDTERLLAALARRLGLSEAAAVRLAVRRLAQAEGMELPGLDTAGAVLPRGRRPQSAARAQPPPEPAAD
jgi:hypothetical protein